MTKRNALMLRLNRLPSVIPRFPTWQISLRSLLVLTTMVAMVLSWWRWFGERFSDLPTYPWVTVVIFFLPFALAGLEFQLRSNSQLLNLLNLSVVLAAVNTVWGYLSAFFVLARSTSNGPDWGEVFSLGMRAALVWSFLLPVSLSLVASALASSENHGRIARHLVGIAFITANLLLLYWGATLLFETPIRQIDQLLSLLYEFLLSIDSRP